MKFQTNKTNRHTLAVDINGHKVLVTVNEFIDKGEITVHIASTDIKNLYIMKPVEFKDDDE